MESFGKSSLKAERREWENDPNVAASEDTCNPWLLHVNRQYESGGDGTRNNLEYVAFFDK